MESFATPYPLMFFDGEQEHDKGFVGIHSSLTFKRFQSLLSQRTGVPHNQLSVVFVCRKSLKGSEKKQRLPINGNTNFAILLNQHNPNKERDCYFLVSVRRSKKERKGSRKRGAESDMPDDWELGNDRTAMEGRGHLRNPSMEDTLSQGSTGSNHSVEMNVLLSRSAFPNHLADNGVDGSRGTDSKAGRVILKRGNPSLLRHGWNHGELQPSLQAGGFVADEYVQLNSPRFAALRPEDQREINWKWEEAFPRVKPREHWDFHAPFALPHINTDVDPLYNHENFTAMSFPEEQAAHRNGRLVDAYNYSPLRNGASGEPCAHSPAHSPARTRELLHFNHTKPSFLNPRTSLLPVLGSKREANVQRNREAVFEGHSQLHFLSDGDWPKMPVASAAFADMQDSSNKKSGVTEPTQNLYCQLCFECRKRNVTPIPFHWCVEDTITNGFRGPSPAGPIGRRAKALHIEAAA